MARDYAAEYRRRMERGKRAGLTPAAARGHARRLEQSSSILKARKQGMAPKKIAAKVQEAKARRVVKKVKQGKPFSQALKEEGISRKSFKKTPLRGSVFKPEGSRRYEFNPTFGKPRQFITTDGELLTDEFLPPDWNTLIDWRWAAYEAIVNNRPERLQAMRGTIVKSARNKPYELETDPQAIRSILYIADVSEEDFFESQGEGRATRSRSRPVAGGLRRAA